nr:MAG TPA: hypothetical protein [Caudoviricetes sp.]
MIKSYINFAEYQAVLGLSAFNPFTAIFTHHLRRRRSRHCLYRIINFRIIISFFNRVNV